METPAGVSALFNTLEAAPPASAAGGRLLHSFLTTPTMSSYLVAFVVGNLTSIQRRVPGGLDNASSHLVRVWGTPDRCATLLPAFLSVCLFGLVIEGLRLPGGLDNASSH